MKNVLILLVALIFCCQSNQLFSQNPFNNCTAACLDKVAIVEDYSKNSQCIINLDATGQLAIYTVEISEDSITPNKDIDFKIAIRDTNTNTLWFFSEKTYQEIPIEDVLSKCNKGDYIVLITVDRAFALPHHEILVK